MIHNSVPEAVGNTPIVRLNKVAAGVGAQLYAKLEFANPGGSLKDRIGWWLIADGENRGLLKPGGVVIEATGGNTGVGLAMAAAVKGYHCIFVVPDKVSEEKQKTLRAFGAKVIVTPANLLPDNPRSNYAVARQLAADLPNALYIRPVQQPRQSRPPLPLHGAGDTAADAGHRCFRRRHRHRRHGDGGGEIPEGA